MSKVYALILGHAEISVFETARADRFPISGASLSDSLEIWTNIIVIVNTVELQ